MTATSAIDPAHAADPHLENPAHAAARTLLLPVDGSAGSMAAARFAAHYAKTFGNTSVVELYVHAPDCEPAVAPTRAVRLVLEEAGVACGRRIESGDPAERILALSVEMDEIVMGRTGVGKAREVFLGSVAQKVLRYARRPVTIVPPDYHPPVPAGRSLVHRILLAVDGSNHSMRAVDYVCALARQHPAIGVDLINVVGPIPPGYLWEFITPERLEHYYQQAGNKALFRARAALVATGVPFNKHIVAGYAIEHMFDAALACGCTRIVIGSVGLGAMAGLALGSVAYRAVHLSPVPVTVVA